MLSFLSGAVNAGGMLACGRFITHVTGFLTLFGIDLAEHHPWMALGVLSVPGYFFLGSMVSGFLIDRRIQKNIKPKYEMVMGIILLCLLIVGFEGVLNHFGKFGGENNLNQDYVFMALLSFISGLQNAAITSYSGFALRTTHMTGNLTDLGVGLVKVLSNPDEKDAIRIKEKRFNWMRLNTIVAFILGAFVGAEVFLHYGFAGFFLPAVIAFYAMIMSMK